MITSYDTQQVTLTCDDEGSKVTWKVGNFILGWMVELSEEESEKLPGVKWKVWVRDEPHRYSGEGKKVILEIVERWVLEIWEGMKKV